jgi:hypothetical protein
MFHRVLASVHDVVEHAVAPMREEKKARKRKEGEAGVCEWIRPHA